VKKTTVSKKRVTRLLAAVLAALLLVTLAACKGGQQTAADISGTYRATQDMSALLNEGLASVEGMELQLPEGITCDYTLTLDKDGAFTLAPDVSTLREGLEEAILSEESGFIDALLGEAGLGAEMGESIAEAGGYDSLDAFREEIANEIRENINSGAMEQLNELGSITGTYEADGKTIRFTQKDSSQGTLSDGTLGDDGSISLTLQAGDSSVELSFRKEG